MSEPFDQIAERYDEQFTDRAGQSAAGDWLLARLPRPARVLDLGCGAGLPTARQLTDGGLAVVGVDSSARMLELAAANASAASYHRADLRAVPDELSDFDAVASFFALLMLPRGEFLPTLRAVRERLRGPRLLALGMVEGDLDGVEIDFLGVPIRVSALSAGALADTVTAAGFEVLELHRHTVDLSDRTETQLFVYARAHEVPTR